MAGMFDNPFVFNRAPILGAQYSPEALYPGMFGQGGAFAQGGMFGPPQQTVKQPGEGIPGFPDLGTIPLPSPPGLLPWDPFPGGDAPVYETPVPPQQAAPQYQAPPQMVQDYWAAQSRATKDNPVGLRSHMDAIKWLNENPQAVDPALSGARAVRAAKAREARKMRSMA